MKLTANRLTLLRILLLPVPCMLLYGGPTAKLTAVGMGSLLGLTDYLDGKLARKQGVTRIGTFLDPIADKIFITAVYLLLAHLHYLPLWLVSLIIFREFLVTILRQIVPGNLPVSLLAKFKTSIQMIAAGLIIVVKTFPSWELLTLCLVAVFLNIGIWFTNFKLKQKILISIFSCALPLISLLSKEHVVLLFGILVLIFTWISGIHYFKKASHFIFSRKKIKLLIEQLVLPLSITLTMYPTIYLWLIGIVVLISELIRQGLKLIYPHSTYEDKFLGILGIIGIGLFVSKANSYWILLFLIIAFISDIYFTVKYAYQLKTYLKNQRV